MAATTPVPIASTIIIDLVVGELSELVSDAETPMLLKALSPEERSRYQRIQRPQRRAQFLAGRRLVQLGREHQWLDSQTPARDASGLPERLNVSHSAEWVACAFAGTGTVGCDIEKILPRDFRGLAELVFSPIEGMALEAASDADRDQCFYRTWTAKEAFSKACRSGLALDWRTVVISLSSRAIFYPMAAIAESEAAQFAAVSAFLGKDLAVAVVLRQSQGLPLELRCWRFVREGARRVPWPASQLVRFQGIALPNGRAADCCTT